MFEIERGDVANVSTLSLGSHTGTHMDAPLHSVRGGEGMDRMPLTATMGRARVIEIQAHFDQTRRVGTARDRSR
jgi:arylformamidase